ncbi:MAG: YggT family protein [Tepidiformaceae bacterium]
MNPTVASIFSTFIWILIIAIIIRSLLSWFPVSPGNRYAKLLRVFTEPLLEPVRRILPRTGMIDLSTMVVIIVLYVMLNVVQRAASG